MQPDQDRVDGRGGIIRELVEGEQRAGDHFGVAIPDQRRDAPGRFGPFRGPFGDPVGRRRADFGSGVFRRPEQDTAGRRRERSDPSDGPHRFRAHAGIRIGTGLFQVGAGDLGPELAEGFGRVLAHARIRVPQRAEQRRSGGFRGGPHFAEGFGRQGPHPVVLVAEQPHQRRDRRGGRRLADASERLRRFSADPVVRVGEGFRQGGGGSGRFSDEA